jgi:hypothetical protein
MTVLIYQTVLRHMYSAPRWTETSVSCALNTVEFYVLELAVKSGTTTIIIIIIISSSSSSTISINVSASISIQPTWLCLDRPCAVFKSNFPLWCLILSQIFESSVSASRRTHCSSISNINYIIFFITVSPVCSERQGDRERRGASRL